MTPAREARRRTFGERRRQQLISQDRWLVSYADLMTLLFALFVVLFAASHHSTDALGKLSGAIHSGFSGPQTTARQPGAAANSMPAHVQAATPAPAPLPNLDALAAQLHGVLGQSIDKHEVTLMQTPEGLVISFEELGFFHTGEANLLSGQAAQIIATGAILQQHDLALRVEGHSDDQPIHNAVFASNWELSAARAMTVLLLLVDQAHYDPVRISMAGYGPYRPVASNTTAEGRQKNRRVDLVVLRAPVTGPASPPIQAHNPQSR